MKGHGKYVPFTKQSRSFAMKKRVLPLSALFLAAGLSGAALAQQNAAGQQPPPQAPSLFGLTCLNSGAWSRKGVIRNIQL